MPGARLDPTLCYVTAGMGLVVPITGTAFVYIDRFDFTAHKGQVTTSPFTWWCFVGAAIVLVQNHRADLNS